MQSTHFSLLICLLLSFLTLVMGDYVDMVITPEKDLAISIDKFVDDHPDTYDFIAKTIHDKIIVQIRFENDTIGIEGQFTETPELAEELEVAQKSIFGATVEFEPEGVSNITLQSLISYRYGEESQFIQEELEKRDRRVCPPCLRCLDFIHDTLKKRFSLCGQFCSTRLSCVVQGCRRCYYTGGACLWQKSCKRG